MYLDYEDDRNKNRNQEPALSKLSDLESVCSSLRKLSLQERFIDFGGLEVVTKWLQKMPDGTYPNVMICRDLMQTL